MLRESVLFDEGEDWEGPATWGQQSFWDGLRRYDRTAWYLNAAPVWEVPEGREIADVLRLIGRAVSGFEGLRTDVREVAGEVRQHVCGRGSFGVDVIEAAGHLRETVAATVRRLRAQPLAGPEQLPFAAAVVTERGRPRQVVWSLSHLSVDASSVRTLLGHLDGTGAWQLATNRSPREQYQLEAGDRLRTVSERSVRVWTATFGDVDLPFAHPRRDSAPGVAQQVLTSTAAAGRLEDLAGRTGAGTAPVLLASVALAVGALLDSCSVPLQLVTSNRHRLDGADYLGVLAQLGPLLARVTPDQSFDEIVAQLGRKSMRAYNSAFWSPRALDAVLRDVGREPDEVLGAASTFNDVRGDFPGPLPHPGTPDEGRDFALRPLDWWPYQGGRCSLAAVGGSHVLQLAARVDTAYLPAQTAEQLLVAVNTVIRVAHVGDGRERAVGALYEAVARATDAL